MHVVCMNIKYGSVSEAVNFTDGLAVLAVLFEVSVMYDPLLSLRLIHSYFSFYPSVLQKLEPRETESHRVGLVVAITAF